MPGRIKTFVYDISNGSFSSQYSLLFALINRNICHGPKGSHWLSVGSQLFQQKQHMPVVVRVTANFDRCNWKCKPLHFSEIFGNFYKLAVHKKRRSIWLTCEISGERRTWSAMARWKLVKTEVSICCHYCFTIARKPLLCFKGDFIQKVAGTFVWYLIIFNCILKPCFDDNPADFSRFGA